jgi:hypothetical protein
MLSRQGKDVTVEQVASLGLIEMDKGQLEKFISIQETEQNFAHIQNLLLGPIDPITKTRPDGGGLQGVIANTGPLDQFINLATSADREKAREFESAIGLFTQKFGKAIQNRLTDRDIEIFATIIGDESNSLSSLLGKFSAVQNAMDIGKNTFLLTLNAANIRIPVTPGVGAAQANLERARELARRSFQLQQGFRPAGQDTLLGRIGNTVR